MNDLGNTGPKQDSRASSMVAAALREGIARGRYLAGERVYQDELAKEFDVSRQPVRQALSMLESEGLLVQGPSGRLTVAKLSSEQLEDNLDCRMIIEPAAARLAAGRITGEQLAALREINDMIRHDPEGPSNLNFDFHKMIGVASGSSTLAQLVERLLFLPMGPAAASAREKSSEWSADQHDLLIDALEKGDGAEAERLMCAHVAETREVRKRRLSRVGA